MQTILLVSPYWKEPHRWMVSSVKLAELWQQIGYRVVVVCMGRESPKTKGQKPKASIETVSEALEIHRLPDVFLPDPWNYGVAFGFSGYVRKLAKQVKPDIVVVNKLLFWSSLSTIALRLRGVRVIQLTDALVGMTWWPRRLFPKVCAAMYAWTLGWLELLCAGRVVFFHPQQEKLLKRLGIAGKSGVIPTGVDIRKFGMRPPAARLLDGQGRAGTGRDGQGQVGKAEFGMGRALTMTYVGRLESIKGVDDFLAAVSSIVKNNASVRAQVVGWYKQGHPLVAQYADHVTFTGLQSDVASILAATDIFVLPSHSEGLSNALMEAMASGCACIASDVGGNRYLIQNGVSGFLFPAGDRDALRSHMQRLLEDSSKRAMLGKAARERIEKHFSWEHVGRQYDQLFSQFTSRG